jgi:uncharacterized protein (DUF1778 family)
LLGLDEYGKLPYHFVMRAAAVQTATTSRLEARLPVEVMERLKRAAEIQGRTLTDFVVSAADQAACEVIEQTQVIHLSLEGQRQIAEAILNPPEPNEALKKAVQRHRELLGEG